MLRLNGGRRHGSAKPTAHQGRRRIFRRRQHHCRGAGIYAETVTAGDPTFAGPLAGVSLGLPVYHILDPLLKAEADPQAWEEQISMMEMVLNADALVAAVNEMRAQHGKDVL